MRIEFQKIPEIYVLCKSGAIKKLKRKFFLYDFKVEEDCPAEERTRLSKIKEKTGEGNLYFIYLQDFLSKAEKELEENEYNYLFNLFNPQAEKISCLILKNSK